MTYYFNFNVIWSNLDLLLLGLAKGLGMAIVSLIIGVLIGMVAAFAAISTNKTLNRLTKIYVTVLRNTPLLVLIYIVYFGFPDINIMMDKVPSFIFTLSLYAGAYITEVFRAGLLAIPKGIIEAGQAIGLSSTQIKFNIQIPIMVRNVLPSMSNTFISLFKDTSLAAAITIQELTYIARKINTETFRVFEAWISAAVLYVIACYGLAYLLRKVEKKLAIK